MSMSDDRKYIFIRYWYLHLMLVSLGIIVIASIFDPFSIPFQDWDTISEQPKQHYRQQSEIFSYLKYLGVAGLLAGVLGSVYHVKKYRKKTMKAKR